MQISPINPITLISPLNPLAASAAVSPAPAVGTRNQAGTAQTGGGGRPAVVLNQRAGEIRLTFPPEYAAEAEAMLHALGETLAGANVALNFSRDDATGAIVVKMVDQTSGETVRQIPSEALLQLSAALRKFHAQIVDQHV